MMRRIYEPVVGLDIGSAKTTACIGNFGDSGKMEIFNAAMVKTRGIERGVITDLGEVAGCVGDVIKKLEAKPNLPETYRGKKNYKITSVHASISGDHVLGNNAKGLLSLSSRPVEISRRDTKRAIDSAKYLNSSLDREILHALSQEFIVDGHRRIKDPLGIYGSRLGVNLHVISAGVSFVSSLEKAINRAGLDVSSVIYSGLATSLVTLTEQEKQQGTVLVELGAGVINILFFKDGSLQFTTVIPMGGTDLNQQLYRSLGVDLAQAEELKMQYRSACSDYQSVLDSCDDKIIIKKESGGYESISRSRLSEIIDDKVNEMLKLVRKELDMTGIAPEIRSVVLCGGMAFMDGMIEKVENTLKVPVNMGIMRGFVSGCSGLSNIFYATAVGLVMHGLNEKNSGGRKRVALNGFLDQLLSRVRNVYEEYF